MIFSSGVCWKPIVKQVVQWQEPSFRSRIKIQDREKATKGLGTSTGCAAMYSRRRISQIVEGESNQVLHNSDLGIFGPDSIADVQSFGSRIKGNLKHQKCKLKLWILCFSENKMSTSSAKAALHKCPGKSNSNVDNVFPVCPVFEACPVYRLCPVWPVWPLQVVAKWLLKWPAWQVSMVNL